MRADGAKIYNMTQQVMSHQTWICMICLIMFYIVLSVYIDHHDGSFCIFCLEVFCQMSCGKCFVPSKFSTFNSWILTLKLDDSSKHQAFMGPCRRTASNSYHNDHNDAMVEVLAASKSKQIANGKCCKFPFAPSASSKWLRRVRSSDAFPPPCLGIST